jgi:hypothetical protein
MSAKPSPLHEQLPSGKVITREFGDDGYLLSEKHCYGLLEIMIELRFEHQVKTEESYFVNRRLVSRKSYEKARAAYPDMPPADATAEDLSGGLLKDIRELRKQKKAEAAQRLAESVESRFPRPDCTNWLRVIAGNKAHLVVFASRDWKVLARERSISTGRNWLQLFGFNGPPGHAGSVAKGIEVGFEVTANREALLNASRLLLTQVGAFVRNQSELLTWHGSIGPRPKPRKKPPLAWPTVLPPLIDFLSNLQDQSVKIFNHTQ